MAEGSVDRTRLPLRRPPFGGVVNRTLAGSRPDWDQVTEIAPEGAPNVLLVLIDDAGFGNPEHVRRADQHAEPDPPGRGRPAVQPLPRDGAVLAHPGGAADRAQPPHSMMGVTVYRQEADEPLPTGDVRVQLVFVADAPAAGHRRGRDTAGQRPTGRQGPDGQQRPVPVLRLRRHGHRPGQRPTGRHRLRRPVAVRVHRPDQAGSSSTSTRT